MAAKIIHIDNYIGRWGYSKELLRLDLEGTRKEGALLRVSSLGGDVFHALDMYNQIASHGNVEVLFAGPSASAATFLAMSAKRVSIVDNCFLLIHKVMAGVDNFGMFNEDELEALIADLRTLRSENREFDKAIAHIYAKRTGRDHQEMISLMKQGTWISAQKALELGFVDGISEPGERLNLHSPRLVAMVSACDLPPVPLVDSAMDLEPEPGSAPESGLPPESDHGPDPTENNNTREMKQYACINRLLEVPELLSAPEGVYLNEDQLQLLEQNMEAALQSQAGYEEAIAQRDLAREESQRIDAELASARTALDASNLERDGALARIQTLEESSALSQNSLEEMLAAINAIDASVAGAATPQEKASAIRALLARLPGAPAPGILDKGDPQPKTDGVDWALIDSLPHNRDIDRNL